MTSRSAQPGQRPPTQRSLSGSGMLQRQAQQRSHLQNQLGTPGSSRYNVVDLTDEASANTPFKPAAPSRAASSLRLQTIAEAKDARFSPGAQQQQIPLPAIPQPWPRGKPKLMFSYQNAPSDSTSQSPSFASSSASPRKDTVPTALPLPSRPVRRLPVKGRSSNVDALPTAKKEKVPKPYVLEVPPDAPKCTSSFNLDFFPWTGDHPEDKFSDGIIRTGFFDKLQPSQNEGASAKQSVHAMLKQQKSLSTIGALFTHVVNERRKSALITSAPTFKPPPRVTLTDTKKETWLRDLANPAISLRRLSRTIPHGIKNKLLLEQCMDKEIPIERAVWLAKCVGANELRASKRKGAAGATMSGGGAKWIRDWTVCVEQFVESTISMFADSTHKVDIKPKVMYCVRLSSHLYSEQLLDSPHYLDYILSNLESSNTARFPVRIFIAGLYQEDLLSHRRTGLRYVRALCSRLHILHESLDRDDFIPVIDKIATVLNDVLRSSPENFISSKTWPQFKSTIETCVDYSGPEIAGSIAMIDRRTRQLTNSMHSTHSPDGPRQEVIKMLDSTLTTPFTTELGKICWRTMKPRCDLARTLIEWATSCYRPGITKIFVAVRLLRIWSRHGLDVNEATLHFLTQSPQSASVSKNALYHLFSELARSGHFSISKYIYWLIARGGLRAPSDALPNGPVATRLLAELPLCRDSDPLYGLRKTLLSRASFSVEDEHVESDGAYNAIKANLRSLSPKQAETTAVSSGPHAALNISTMSRAVRADLGRRIRQLVQVSVVGFEEGSTTEGPAAISLDDFVFIRRILEQFEDIAMLADVLELLCTAQSSSPAILASCADTVNVHADSLTAIGAFHDLFGVLVGRYRTLSIVHGSRSAVLRHSLCALAGRTAGAKELHTELSKEIARLAHKATIEACSPVSDHVVEVLQKDESTCSDEIEKLLDSGSSMDSSTFVRLFEVLVARIEATWSKESVDVQKYSTLLGRLRIFHTEQFGSMLSTWLDDVVQRTHRPIIAHVIGPLMSSDCVTFDNVLKRCNALLQKSSSSMSAVTSRIAIETLNFILAITDADTILQSQDLYNLHIKRIEAQSAHYTTILEITRRTLEMGQPAVDGQTDALAALCAERRFIDFMQRLVLIHFDDVTAALVVPLAKSGDAQVLLRLRNLLRSLLDLAIAAPSSLDMDPANRITTIIDVASDLTLPLCQLALRSVFVGTELSYEASVGGTNSSTLTLPLEAFRVAVDNAMAMGKTTWTSIVSQLDVQVAQNLYESAETSLISILPLNSRNADSNGYIELAKQKLFIMAATAYSMQNYRKPLLLVERVNELIKQIIGGEEGIQYFETLQPWLPLIMEAVTLSAANLGSAKQTGEIRGGLVLMLASLHLLMRSKHLGGEEDRETVFDTILCLADDLNDESRIRCVHSLVKQGTLENSTPGASGGTPAIYPGNVASTPGSARSPAQATFHVAPSIPMATATSTTAEADPELCYALSFNGSMGSGLMLSQKGKVMPFQVKRWETLSDPTPIAGENDTSLSMRLFEARKV